MQTEQIRHLPPGYGRRGASYGADPNKHTVAWILLLAVLGFLAISGLCWFVLSFPRLGVSAAIAIVLAVPIALVSGALAIPQVFAKLAALRPKLRWWHALWFLLYVSTLVFRVRDQEATQAQPLDAWALLRILPEMIVVGWLMVRLYRRREALVWVRCLVRGLPGALTIFALVCAASAMWSVYPAWTLYKSLEYLLDISVLAAALANIRTLDDYEILFNWTWTIFGLELAWVWFQLLLWPSEAFLDARLHSVIPAEGSNAVGQSGALFAVIALCRLLPLTGRRLNTSFSWVLFVLGLLSLLLSQTRNAVAGFVLAVVVVLIVSRRTLMVAVASVVGVLTWLFTPLGNVALAYLQREQSSAAMASLTGRAEIWTYALQQFMAHPFTGMGAYAAGRFYIMTKLGADTASLHSDWIELLVGVGLLGLIPFLVALLGTWWFLIRGVYNQSLGAQGRQMAFEGLGVLAVITVHSFFNVELTWHVPLLLFVLLGYAELLRRQRVMVPSAVPSFLVRPVGPRTPYSPN